MRAAPQVATFLALVIVVLKEAPPSMSAERPWFNSEDCQSLEIKKHRSISTHEVVASASVVDPETLKRIIWRIKRIPTNGDMMKSFDEDAQQTDLEFHCQGKVQVIEIYEKRFKTPSTGFNTGDEGEEKLLTAAIEGLLTPDFGRIILKARGQEYPFKAFGLTFVGTTHFDHAPATTSSSIDHFLLRPTGEAERKLEIRSGQLFPQPLDFKIGKTRYTLRTYESERKNSSQDTDRLYPDFFQVTRH